MKTALLSLVLSLPLLAAGHPLGERALAPTAYAAIGPVTAFSGTRFLTLWTEQMGGIGRHVKGAFSDAEGHRVSPASFTLLRDVNPEWMQLVGTGDAYVLFWRDNHQAAWMVDIDLEGRVTGTRALDLPRVVGNMGRVAWNGSRFFVALEYSPHALLLERDGDVVKGNIPVVHATAPFSIVPTSNGFVVLGAGNSLIAYRVTNEGASEEKVIEGLTAPSLRPSVAAAVNLGNDDVLMAWQTGNHSDSRLRTAVLTRDGNITQVHELAVANVPLVPLALLRTSGGAVLAYLRATTLFTTRISAGGEPAGATFEGPPVLDPSTATNGHLLFIVGSMNDVVSVRRAWSIVAGTNGALGTPELLSISPARQLQPALTAAGGRLLATWTDLEGDAASLRTAVVDADARPLEHHVIGASFLAADDVVWNGTEALAVTHANGQLLATRVDANGAAIDAEPIVLGTNPPGAYWQRRAAVTWADDRWLVVWPGEQEILFASVSRAGVATEPRILNVTPALPPNYLRSIRGLGIAFDGTRALLVWNESRMPICYFPICLEENFTLARRLTRDGNPVEAPAVELPSLRLHDRFSIATSGTELVVLGGPEAVTLDTQSDTPRILASRALFGALSDVTWDGREYVIALRYQLLRTHLAVRRVDAKLAETAAARGVETLPAYTLQAPGIAPIDGTRTMIAVEEGDADQGARATVYREDELPPLVLPPAPPRNVRTELVNGTYYLSWDPPLGEVELYHVEVLAPHGWVWVAQVPASVRTAASHLPVMRVRAINAGGYSAFAMELARRRSVRR